MAVGIRTNTDSETLDTSPGGLFTNPDDVTSIDLSTVEGHLNDAVDGARNSKGWAVGNPDDPLTGWSTTNNSKYYSEQASDAATNAASSATNAAASATAALNSANDAAGSAQQASASATSAQNSAAAALASETAAAVSASQAAASATSAAESATNAATSESNAAASAREADSDARAVEADLAEARQLAVEVRQLHQEVASDSEELHLLEIRVRADSEEIARDLARAEEILLQTAADSDAAYESRQIARAFAEGRGTESGLGYGRGQETSGVRTLSSQSVSTNFVNVLFPGSYLATNAEGFITQNITDLLNDTNETIEIYKNYLSQGEFTSADFIANGSIDTAVIRRDNSKWDAAPVAGDIIHVFVTTNGEIADYRSAYFQAARAFYFQGEARRFDSDAQQRDSEITSLVNGANARIDSEKIVRRDADIALQAEIDSDVAALRGDIRTIIDSDIRHIHARINEVVVVGYGLDYIEADSDIIVDSDVIASVRKLDSEIFAARAYTDEEIANLIGASPGIYTTLTRIREALDSDETVLDSLVAYMDSDRMAREQLAADLRADVDSDAAAIRAVGARIDSEQSALRADIDSDATAIRRLDGRIDSEKVVRAAEDTVLNNRIDSEIRNLHRRVSGVVDVGYGLQYNTADSDIFVDSDVISSRRYVDSEIAAIRATLDSEGGAAGSFRSLNDTPNSYQGQANNYPRVNADSDALVFFDPFPVNQTNNRLTTLNGMRIRTIGSNYIEFVSFAPSVSVNAITLNWDQAVSGFGVAFQNNDDFPDEFIQRVNTFNVGSTAIPATGFSTSNSHVSSGTLSSSATFLSNQAWDGSSDTFAMTSTVQSNLSNNFTATGANLIWRGWSASGSTDIGNQLFDTVDTSYVARLTINNTSDITNNVSNATFTPADSGSGSAAQSAATTGTTTSVTFSGLNILSNTRVRGTITGTATKPDTVIQDGLDSDYAFSHGWDNTPNTQHRVWFIVGTAAPNFGNPGNGGYTNPAGTVQRNDNTTSMARGRNEYGAGQTGVNLYVVGRGTINSISETTNPAFPITQTVPTPTTITLGHTGNTYSYNVYQIPLANNAGNFYTIT